MRDMRAQGEFWFGRLIHDPPPPTPRAHPNTKLQLRADFSFHCC